MNYATQTLAQAVEAASLDFGSPMKKAIIDTAKFSASIAALLAHAGRVRAPRGADAIDVACIAMWDAIRSDITALTGASSELESAKDRVRAVRDCAPFWVGRAPSWAKT